LSNAECAEYVLKGADAFVSVDASIEELIATVLTVASGGSVLQPAVARTVAIAGRQRSSGAPEAGFTLRERQLIESMQAGHSVKETARLLGLSVRTVHEAQRRLFANIGARNRAHALSLIHASGGVPVLIAGEVGEDLRSSG
jgi:DNA-binding NarL/FixJ family response regulator